MGAARFRLRTVAAVVATGCAASIGWLWLGNSGAALLLLLASGKQWFVGHKRVFGADGSAPPALLSGEVLSGELLSGELLSGEENLADFQLLWRSRRMLVLRHPSADASWFRQQRLSMVFSDECSAADFARLRRCLAGHIADGR